jgi:hypothetical protein
VLLEIRVEHDELRIANSHLADPSIKALTWGFVDSGAREQDHPASSSFGLHSKEPAVLYFFSGGSRLWDEDSMNRAIVSLLVAAWSLVPLTQDKKVPAPDAAAQKDMEKVVRDVYKEEYKSKAPKDRIAFAEKLLKQAKETKSDPVAQYVMLRESMTIAGEEREVSTAFGAIEALALIFEDIRELDLKLAVLAKAKAGLKAPSDAVALAEQYVTVAQQCWKANSFDVALKALGEAAAAAKAGKDIPLITRVNELSADAKEAKDAYEKVKPSEGILAINDSDPEANAEYGWFLALIKAESEKGLQLLSKGPPDKGPYAEFTGLVQEESKAQASKEFLAVGEKWFAIATKATGRLLKRNAMAQARRLYERALQGAEGLSRAQIEKRLAETRSSPAAAGGAPSSPIDLLKIVDPKKDAFAGTWERDGANIKAVKASYSRLEIPYEPPDEYDLKMVFQGVPVSEAVALLSRRGKGLGVGMKPGLGHGAYYSSSAIVTLDGLSLAPNTPHTLLVQVRLASIRAHLDGKELQEWKPDQNSLAPHPSWANRNPQTLGIGATGDSMVFQSISIVEIAGRGKRLR